MSKATMKLALEALKLHETAHECMVNDAIKALEEALAKQEQHTLSSRVNDVRVHIEHGKQHDEAMKLIAAKQEQGEPVRGVYWKCVLCGFAHIEDECPECGHHTRAEFAFPQPQQRKPLTDEQIYSMVADITDVRSPYIQFARAIEAAHGIKE